MLSISATAGSCPVIARSRRQSACLATHKFAACRAKVVRWTCRRPGNRCPKWRRKWACRPWSVSRPRNSPTISTVSTSLSARTGAGPRWRSLRPRQRSRTKSSTTQNTTMMRVSRSMAAAHEAALPRLTAAVPRRATGPLPLAKPRTSGGLQGPRQPPRRPGRGRGPPLGDRPDLRPGRRGDPRHRWHDGGPAGDRARPDPRALERRRRGAPPRQGRRGRHPERRAALVQGGQRPLPLLHRQADRPQGERVVRPPRLTLAGTAALLLGTAATALAAPVSLVAPEGKPAAIVDLRTEDGVRLVGAAWRYSDAHLVEVAARAAGPDMRPSGPEVRATDIEPKAGTADFQDASWDEVPPAALEARRGSSRLSFGWYRVRVTVPDHIGGFDPTGSTLVLDTVLDDYAEVWVDGRLPLALGQNGGQAIAGFNAPNRVVLGRGVHPGQQFQVAIFAANGPLSSPPANYVWMRSATLDFYRPKAASPVGEIVRVDPALDGLLAPDARV